MYNGWLRIVGCKYLSKYYRNVLYEIIIELIKIVFLKRHFKGYK